MKLNYEENMVTKKCCDTCEFNMGVCAGSSKRKDNGEDMYGVEISIAKKMYPKGCDDYGINLYSYILEQKSLKIPWMERMTLLETYTNFTKKKMKGMDIVNKFNKYNEKYGKQYVKTRKENIDILDKFPNINVEEYYYVFTKKKYYDNKFCGIFTIDKKNCVGFFAYE